MWTDIVSGQSSHLPSGLGMNPTSPHLHHSYTFILVNQKVQKSEYISPAMINFLSSLPFPKLTGIIKTSSIKLFTS